MSDGVSVSGGRDDQIHHFLRQTGWSGAARGRLAGDASFRHYDRLELAGHRAVLMDAPPPELVAPFASLARHLLALGFSVPKVLAEDSERGFLLLEDLGDDTYTRLLNHGHDAFPLYALAVDTLADLHNRPDAIPADVPAYDDERLLAEALLLPDWYLPQVLGRACSEAERESYCALWRDLFPLARAVPQSLVLRDFHVDNLMLLPREGLAACGLLDFQDAVAGPITYDLMSLLEDARRDLDPALVADMKARYLALRSDVTQEAFDLSWAVLAAQRHCKVIGIFTRLCKRDGKPIYLQHIPRVFRLLEAALVAHPALGPLRQWLDRHLPPERRIVPSP